MVRPENVLVCPITRNRLSLDFANSEAKVEGTAISYPIRDGIIDFLPGVDDGTSRTYDSLATFYSAYAMSANMNMKLLNLVYWGLASQYVLADKVLAFIPDDFDGILLDVPVGTGILTCEKYRRLTKATIIAIDYSLGMLQRARHLYAKNGLTRITLIRADVGNLPIDDDKIDACLSMNGFHSFPKKGLALREICRVLKHSRSFLGCFYIRGKRKLSDFFVRTWLSERGFIPPFYDDAQTRAEFGQYFNVNSATSLRSFFCFDMAKK